jgi:LPXTG-motif cell wall-anchored protein
VNRIRIGLVGLVVLTLTGVTAGGANAATGRGTAAASITLLDVSLGNVQNLKVLTDEGQSTLDAARLGVPNNRAFGQLSAVTASGALNLAIPEPAYRAEAPGTTTGSLDPISFNFPGDVTDIANSAISGANATSPVALPGVPTGPLGAGFLASGVIDPVKIEAFMDAAGARSAVGTEVPNLDVLQGLISVRNVKVGSMSASASPSQSQGDTGVVTIGDITVLDLGGFLGGLGLGLSDLNVGTLTSLVDNLGIAGVNSGALGLGDLSGTNLSSVLGTVTGLTGLLSTVSAASDCGGLDTAKGLFDTLGLNSVLGDGGLLGSVTSLDSLLGVGGLLGGCTTASFDAQKHDALEQLNGALGTFQGLFDSVFGALDSAPLIQLSGVEFSALAKAAETLEGSSASTTASFGTLKVGGLSLGVLDVNATVAQINDLVGQLEGTLNGVLGPLGLGNLIDIGIMERTSSVKAEGAYNVADAGLNVLRVSINPPAALSSVLGPLTSLPVSNVLGSVITGLPVDTGLASNALANAFGLTSLLSQPTTIKVGAIRAQSDFTTAAAGVTAAPGPLAPPAETNGTLPRTGSNNGAWMAALAALALAGAFGITRSLRKPPVSDEG